MHWKKFRKDRACYYLVWSWNLIYLLVAASMLIPYVVIETINDALVNAVPWSFALYSSLTVVFPLSFMILALVTGLRRKPFLLLKLFYGIEVPIVFLLLCRIVLLREMNPGMIHLALNVALAFCAYLYLSLEHESGMRGNTFSSLCRLGAATIVLLVGLYLAGLILPFAVPLGWLFLKSFFPDLLRHVNTIILNPFSIIYIPLMFYTATLFIALPFVLLYLYLTAFIKQWRDVPSCSGSLSSVTVVAGVLLIEISLFITLNHQKQAEIYALLKSLEEKPECQIELLDRKNEISDILTDAYLGAYRYVSTDKKSNVVEIAYQEAFGSSSNWIAQSSQWLFNSLARPFLYHGGDFAEDQELAAHYYQLFFDAPIEKAQAERIARAIDMTWERESGAAGLINALSEHVLLTEQVVTVEPRGDAARITISQRLENTTFQPIEVVYHFSLPEEAVLTGVWLSDEPNNPEKYIYRVSPRGAAQQVYKAQVLQRVDPSLLEQVGPRQYRLRAYPVPSRQLEYTGRAHGYMSRA
ncbi:MAG: TIGR02921 family PEP-CTERM protein, partial [Desulfobulbaceae bacterium]|nr:TIGR02921 family PEP-CTERM protein [Desulfobulbaceae bacterium]